LAAAQGIDFRFPLKPGIGTNRIYQLIRKSIPAVVKDRLLGADLSRMKELMKRRFK
jgi:histidine ammonia-lyase